MSTAARIWRMAQIGRWSVGLRLLGVRTSRQPSRVGKSAPRTFHQLLLQLRLQCAWKLWLLHQPQRQDPVLSHLDSVTLPGPVTVLHHLVKYGFLVPHQLLDLLQSRTQIALYGPNAGSCHIALTFILVNMHMRNTWQRWGQGSQLNWRLNARSSQISYKKRHRISMTSGVGDSTKVLSRTTLPIQDNITIKGPPSCH